MGFVLMVTYVWGIMTLYTKYPESGGAAKLWGHIGDPEYKWLLYTYFTSIGMATVGFFPALAYALCIAHELPRGLVNKICGYFACFYVTEWFWLPMCVAYLASPSTLVYTLIRLQLLASGIMSLCWAYTKVFQVPCDVAKVASPALRISGKVGTCAFALHCALLDAIIWPPFFRS